MVVNATVECKKKPANCTHKVLARQQQQQH